MTLIQTRPSADPTRKAIINAARHCFAQKGFAGSSISYIAKQAEINQSLIYHHFGNKRDLWIAVKIQILDDYHNQQTMNWDKLLTIKNCYEFISEFIRYRFGLFDCHPDTLRIIEWQYLEPDPFDLSTYSPDILEKMTNHIKSFQEKKAIKKDYNSELILSMLLAIPLGFFRSYKDFSQEKSADEIKHLKENYLELCINTINSGIVS